MPADLIDNLQRASPRFVLRPTPLNSTVIHAAVILIWLAALAQIFLGHGISAWSVGIIYMVYDTILILFTFTQTLKLWKDRGQAQTAPAQPATMTVLIACHNEAQVIDESLAALAEQQEPPEQIIIVDDGSTDATAEFLQSRYGFAPPQLEGISPPGPVRWLRMSHKGKAAALNQAMLHVGTELFVTVDADTVIHANGLKAMKDSFRRNQNLVAATGVLTPISGFNSGGRILGLFQTYEYMRNFLSRYAWANMKSLLLISGAFACFRTQAVIRVGGFDATCIVEDYELIHRLLCYSYDHRLQWQSTVTGDARAGTMAPGNLLGFLRQRRRWFSGFLQTQSLYRHMVGNRSYRRLGMMMLPVKAIDTLQPVYGLSALLLLLYYIGFWKVHALVLIAKLILLKLCLDLIFILWSVAVYRRWTGDKNGPGMAAAVAASIAEPLFFQPLRHLGACWGWLAFLRKDFAWGRASRADPRHSPTV